ncbi:AAA domain-containing protein [Vararia minispora EC-137]|uniref:AAA domain-containing protein n=1 Tax=Vararia minispora EC-137 TaxID=1314806 RepID=A0ACB8QZL7_9AGAM|nr:AAA domain-containing protein [Vararia minispora EC-137]
MSAPRRLRRVREELAPPPQSIGTLRLGAISFDVPAAATPARLPRVRPLDIADPGVQEDLHWMLQKYVLGQDVFLLGQPGPYARRLAMTFCSMINAEYEHVALHRDVGETELKQGREIRDGGQLLYVDSAAVRAVKHGRILILEGIEKAERGIMPLLNNLLENRELNLDDGTHILHPHRHALLPPDAAGSTNSKDAKRTIFVPAHPRFRVIAIAAPVPPNTGYPLDPPFRSRFQARAIDPVVALVALARAQAPPSSIGRELGAPESSLEKALRALVLATQYATESSHVLDSVAPSALPAFPQTTLARLSVLLRLFPPPPSGLSLSPPQLARLVLTLHPRLLVAPFAAWALLSERAEAAGLGPLGNPGSTDEVPPEEIGLVGYVVRSIERVDERRARVTFAAARGSVAHIVPAGSAPLLPFPPTAATFGQDFIPSPRFLGLLTSLLQAHALQYDALYVPPPTAGSASCSTSTLARAFGGVLGYEREGVYLWKEMGGREVFMRRVVGEGGGTRWEPSAVTDGAWKGRLVHLDGLDVLGLTAGALARLTQDREVELWEAQRVVAAMDADEVGPHASDGLSTVHPSFRLLATASGAQPLRDWLTDEHANMFFCVPALPMPRTEERAVMQAAGCPAGILEPLLAFAEKYRATLTADSSLRNRRLGTRALVRVARRLALNDGAGEGVFELLSRALLTEFLPALERATLEELMRDCGFTPTLPAFHPAPLVTPSGLLFLAPSNIHGQGKETLIPAFDAVRDPAGAASFVPHMDHFFDNSVQTAALRALGTDLELLGEHLVLLGNQGVGKNKLVDRLCQLLGRPREYVQLHRDSTVQQLLLTTTLERGVLRNEDSPLLRAVKFGRVLVVDEADKAPEHVVAVFRSLAGQGEISLPDGRRVRRTSEREGDVVIRDGFRLVLLANRPGYPFLGNHFLQVLGDNFSLHAIANPDLDSELRLLAQLAPLLPDETLRRLVGAFQDLRRAHADGALAYPYSLRELIAVVRHMREFASDSPEDALRNVFDFDVWRPGEMDKLAEILQLHGLGMQRAGTEQENRKKVLDVAFEPKKTDLDRPKFGKEDPDNAPHTGGNTWAGGSGGRDTAGLGGRGGYMRLYKGHDINQVSDKLKQDVPDAVRDQAREMARRELARRLEELDMSAGDARGYGDLLSAVQAHIAQLHDLLENLAAKEEERVWVKRQTDGELDDTRLTEGLTGEATVYKRRGMAKPELGRPQLKPKRIRFLFDVSGSMYRFQYDGRLQRGLETAVMLMESFNRLTRKEKYAWDIYGHSGDSPEIPIIRLGESVAEVSTRWKAVKKMDMITQYTFAGDHTVDALGKAAVEVAKFDGDDYFVIAITDANFARYGITAEDLRRAMNRHPKVKVALICIGEGAESAWVPQQFPGRAFRVEHTADIPKALRGILSSMMEK